MKHRLLRFVVLGWMILSLAACSPNHALGISEESPLPYILSSEPVYYEDLRPLTDFKGMYVEKMKTEDGCITYELVNAGKQTFCYGETTHLNILLDGDWYAIEPDPEEVGEGVILVSTDMSYAVEPGTSRAEKMPIRLLGIDDLVPGEYRLVFQGNWGYGKMQWIYVPFQID